MEEYGIESLFGEDESKVDAMCSSTSGMAKAICQAYIKPAMDNSGYR